MSPPSSRWSPTRPGTLVVACSDGRLQQAVDDFLRGSLGITDYDRLYLPGGPGALVDSSQEYLRKDLARRDLWFLLEAHQVKRVVLLFHGAADDGPEEAGCADYRRRMPYATRRQLARQMQADAGDLLRSQLGNPALEVLAFRLAVQADARIEFQRLVALPPSLSRVSRLEPRSLQ